MANDTDMQRVSPSSTALNAEHYQSFEMAKANDDVLGGENITAIRGYAARVRAEAQVIHKSLSMMSDYDDAVAAKSEIFESEQTLAKVGIYADQRIGEILRELPTRSGARTDITSSTAQDKVTKTEAIEDAGITRSQAYDLQAMAANPEVVEAVIAKATEEGRVPSRKQVLDAIDEKKRAERERMLAEQERDIAKEDAAEAWKAQENAETEVVMLRRQLESVEHPKPEVIEREVEVVKEVVPSDYETMKRRVSELEQRERMHSEDNRNLRKQLEDSNSELGKAREILGMDENLLDVRRDAKYLVSATNSYMRQYGGLAWTVEQLADVDEDTRDQLKKAATNMAAFATAMVNSLEEFNGR